MTSAIALFVRHLLSRKAAQPVREQPTNAQLYPDGFEPEYELYLPVDSTMLEGEKELKLLRRGSYDECDEHIQSNFELARRRDELFMRATGKLVSVR